MSDQVQSVSELAGRVEHLANDIKWQAKLIAMRGRTRVPPVVLETACQALRLKASEVVGILENEMKEAIREVEKEIPAHD